MPIKMLTNFWIIDTLYKMSNGQKMERKVMAFWEMLILGISLAIDATAVSITNGLAYKKLSKQKIATMVVAFGVFQGVMPLIGYYVLSLTSLNANLQKWIAASAGLIAFLLLLFIGGKMIIDAIKEIKNPESIEEKIDISFKEVFLQAIATSIDALAVGFSLYLSQQKLIAEGKTGFNIFIVALTITVVTTIMSLLGVIFGKAIGKVFKKIAPIIGGVVLICIGLSILLS